MGHECAKCLDILRQRGVDLSTQVDRTDVIYLEGIQHSYDAEGRTLCGAPSTIERK